MPSPSETMQILIRQWIRILNRLTKLQLPEFFGGSQESEKGMNLS